MTRAATVALATFLFVTSLVLLVAAIRAQSRSQLRRALQQLEKRKPNEEGTPLPASSGGILADGFTSLADLSVWAAVFSKLPNYEAARRLIIEAGMTWSPVRLFQLSGVAAAVGGMLGLLIGNGFWSFLTGLVLGAFAPFWWVRKKRKQRLRAFEEQLPEAIDLLARAVRAGHPLTVGVGIVADESPEPLASEFRRVYEEQRFGLPFEDALRSMADRVQVVDLKIAVSAILLQREVGGSLGEFLDRVAHMIRERFQFGRQLAANTAQGRLSGRVLSGLPIAVALMIFVVNPSYLGVLFTTPTGRLLVALSVIMMAIGNFWIRRVVMVQV